MSITTTTTTTRDRGDRYGPIEWAQLINRGRSQRVGCCQVSSVAVAYATASPGCTDDGEEVAVGITLSQFIPSSSSQTNDSQPLQHGAVSDVRLEFVSIPLLDRAHQLYRWTRSVLARIAPRRHC